LAPLIDFPKDRDLAILLVEAAAKVKGETRRYRALMIDRGDTRTSFSAMERTTGFPTAVIAHMQARGKIRPGARPIELAVPLDEFLRELNRHGIHIRERLGNWGHVRISQAHEI
ncbi:MAG: saccharopine dehydrogenase C-terminal domain-containing protein, partial [Pseudomonadota bacterium]